MKKLSLGILIIILSLASCKNEPVPRQHGYPRFEFPEKKYLSYSCDTCPYVFDYPDYAEILADSGDMSAPCWINVFFRPYNATLHISYKHLKNRNMLDTIVNQSYEMAFKHSIKAEDIREIEIRNKYGSSGIFYEIDGNTATALQFYMHDSVKHYLRGALYFNSRTVVDSVQPVLDFIKKDMQVLTETLRWKD